MKKYLAGLFLFVSYNISASTFYILLKSDINPDTIVTESVTSRSPPNLTIQAFNTINPDKVEFLIKERATGNLLTIMNNSPNWARTKLQHYLSLTYAKKMNINAIRTSLINDPMIDFVSEIDGNNLPSLSVPFPTANQLAKFKRTNAVAPSIINAVGVDIQSAWALSEGMGYVGIADGGLQVNHPDLRAFDGSGTYVGGNLLDSFYSIDFAKTTGFDLNVDELKPVPAGVGTPFENCDFTDGDPNNDLAVASFVGHGTHVSGLIGAKGGLAPGICKNCGISMMKFYGAEIGSCSTIDNITSLFVGFSFDAYLNSWDTLVNLGVGTINLSAGIGLNNANICNNNPSSPECLILKKVEDNEILFTGAAGNNRVTLQFPSSDPRVAAAGGLTETNDFWNESPTGGDNTNVSSNTNCPQYPPNSGSGQLILGQECGSNFSFPSVGNKTDVMTQARNVYSIFYQGQEHNPLLPNQCTDAFDGTPNDGYGLCTGTSMSAPQTTAIFQLMRSANPLLPNGTYDPTTLIGLRNVLNATAERSINGLGHDEKFGYGQPSARKALEMILGKSSNVQMKTRLTPMFTNVSAGANNNVYTPFPQISLAYLLVNGANGYTPDSSKPLVNEFSEFWYDTVNLTLPAPRAEFYVFTTNNNPFSGVKNMIPLRRMEKSVGSNRNDTYAVSNAEIQNFHNNGYNYAGIEGYILPSPESGTIALYRDQTDSMNHKLVTSNSQPPNSILLGYVYLNQDSDNDGLIDGQEIILGTNVNNQDSDGDGVSDGIEYPPAGVPVSDPLLNPVPIFNSNINPAIGLDFGNVEFGATSVKTIVVNNLGQGDLNVTSCSINNTNFTLSGCPFTIPGSSLIMNTVNVVCNPQNINTTTQLNATLTMNTNDPSSPQVNYPLTCKALRSEFQSNVSQGQQIDFSFVNDGASESRSIEISNLGQGDLQVTGCSVNNTNFTVTGCPFNIPGSSVTTQDISVQCTPSTVTQTTTLVGTLTINTNDADEATVNYSLNCTALSPDALFADSGEPTSFNGACDLSRWSGNYGFTAATQATTPRYNGVCGFQQSFASVLEDKTPLNEPRLRARFYFYAEPSGTTSGTGITTLLTAFQSNSVFNQVFDIKFDGTSVIINSTGLGVDAVAAVSNTGWHSVEFDWNQNGQIYLWVDSDAKTQPVSASGTFNTMNRVIGAIYLGEPGQLDSNYSRVVFDDYESHRTTVIGKLVRGDSSANDVVTIIDATVLVNEIMGNSMSIGTPDCNEDGAVSISDATCIVNIITGN